jgi:hypothetical protein
VNNGDIYKTNKYGNLKVVNYVNSRSVIVEFVDTGYKTKTQASHIMVGIVRDPMRPYAHGVGYIGVGVYKRRSKPYSIWNSMLYRCYSQESMCKNPTYRGCDVDKDWHNFQVFAKWYEQNYKDGYELDKDLLIVGNRTYSQDTCVFVPSRVNCFIINSSAARGKYPIGVYYHKRDKKYVAHCKNGKGVLKHLGYFTDPSQAHLEWKNYKLSLALDMKSELDAIDERIYPNIVTIINDAK